MDVDDFEKAENYDISSRHFQSLARKNIIDQISFTADDAVLDVGCGSGISCKEVAEKVRFVSGIDISSAMISVAKEKNGGPNIEYHVADAHTFGNHLQEWKEKFDKVTSFLMLHWCTDQKQVLNNIYQCLKPGGIFLLYFNLETRITSKTSSFGETCDAWLRRHPKWGAYIKNYVHVHTDWKHSRDFLEMFRSVGFTVIKTIEGDMSEVPLNETHIKGAIKALLGHLRAIPQDLRDECVDDIRDWLYDVTPKATDGAPIGPPIGEIRQLTTVVASK